MTQRTIGYTVLAMLFAILLTGCAAPFDPNEYSRMVDVRVGLQESRCANDPDAAHMAATTKSHLEWLAVYSQNLPDNANTTAMIAAIKRSADEFANRYSQGNPSTAYCRLKVRAMQEQIDTIIKTTGRRPR